MKKDPNTSYVNAQEDKGINRRSFMTRSALIGAGLTTGTIAWASAKSNAYNKPIIIRKGIFLLQTTMRSANSDLWRSRLSDWDA